MKTLIILILLVALVACSTIAHDGDTRRRPTPTLGGQTGPEPQHGTTEPGPNQGTTVPAPTATPEPYRFPVRWWIWDR